MNAVVKQIIELTNQRVLTWTKNIESCRFDSSYNGVNLILWRDCLSVNNKNISGTSEVKAMWEMVAQQVRNDEEAALLKKLQPPVSSSDDDYYDDEGPDVIEVSKDDLEIAMKDPAASVRQVWSKLRDLNQQREEGFI
jgi:hypothetical protein